jgi:tetratricopeptide (TPR) repeat protein
VLTSQKHSSSTFILITVFCLLTPVQALKTVYARSLNIENFSHNYQYKYIANHIKDKNNKLILELKKHLNTPKLSITAKYFINHNLAYALFKLHKKNASLKQINKTIAALETSATKKQLTFYHYHLSKSLLLRAKTLGILFRQTKKAIPDLKEAILSNKQSHHTKAPKQLFNLQTAMAQAYNQLGQLNKAKKTIAQALTTAKQLNDKNETIYALIISGRIAYQQKNFTLAYHEYLKALELSDESTPKKRIASIELRLAIAYEEQSIYDQALVHAKRAMNLYNQLKEEDLQIKTLRVLGNIYLSLGQDIDTALVHFINGLTIAKKIDDPYSIGQMQHLVGKSYLLENQITLATQYLNSAQNILKKSKDWFYLGLNTIELAKLAQYNNHVKKAIDLLISLRKNNHFQSYPALLKQANDYLISLYLTKKQFKKAYFLQQEMIIDGLNEKNKNITAFSDKNNTQEFNKIVELKTLKEKLAKEANALKVTQQQLLELNKHIKFYLIILIITIFAFVISYIQAKKWHKRYKQRLSKSVLTWSIFQNKIINNAATAKARGILLIFNTKQTPCYFSITKNENIAINIPDEEYIKIFIEKKLSYNITHYNNMLWALCNKNMTKTKALLMSEKRDTANKTSFIWIDLTDFPTNISKQALLLIELLSHYIIETKLCEKQTQDKENKNRITASTFYKISIQAQALPLIFINNKTKKEIASGLQNAVNQKLITFKNIE